MPAGDGFSKEQRHRIDRAMRAAEITSRYEFSVLIGTTDGPSRAYAERLHASLVTPDRSVLIFVDPAARVLEIVTGKDVRLDITDDDVATVAASMSDQFLQGELVDGVCLGLGQLAEASR